MHSSKQQNSKWYYIGISIVLFCMAVSLIGSCFTSPSHPSFDSETVYTLETVWYNTLDSSEVTELPASFPYDENGTTVIYTTLPDYSEKGVNSFCLRASQSAVNIWLDNKQIYKQDPPKRSLFSGKSPGSHWILLRLPDDYAGKELRIESTSPYASYVGKVNEVYIGTKASLMYHIIHMYGMGFFIAIIFLFLSITLFAFGLICYFKKIPARQVILLALFGLMASFWMIGESHMQQFFTKRIVPWHNATMLTFNLLPLPLQCYVSDIPNFRYRRFCRITMQLQLLYVVVLLVTQYMGGPDMLEMLDVSIVCLIFHCVSMPVLLYYDLFHNKNREALPISLAGLVLSLCSATELLLGLFDLKPYAGDILRYGIFAFYIILSIFALQQALTMYVQARQSSYYQMLSHTDQMTNCKNRRDFMEHTAAWQPGNNDAILMIDINYLKTINDTYGHAVGDTYIMACADVLRTVFTGLGDCFRMGGDEFLFWGQNLTEEEITKLEELCTQLVLEKCRSISPLCSISTGTAIYQPGDASISDTIKRADLKMYEQKRKLKRVEIHV